MADVQFDDVVSWWKALQDDNGGRAELRRAHDSSEVTYCPAFYKLYNKVEGNGSARQLQVIAGILAHVRANDPGQPFGKQLQKAGVSELRFRRLLTVQTREDLYEPLIRMVKMLDGKVNVLELARDVYFWGDSVRRRWGYAYYGETD